MATEVIALPAKESGSKNAQARFYRPELDVLRFFAFFSVFTIHALALSPGTIPFEGIIAPAGAYGLPLFFFLSSYLITELLSRERESTGKIHLKAFYVRRILRIWPLYFGFLLFSRLFGQIFPFFHVEASRLVAFIFLAGNFYMVRFGGNWSPADILWSISVEEQFYLLWPSLARIGGKRLLVFFSVLLFPAAWLYLALNHRTPVELGLGIDATVWCNSIVQFQFFALGALCSTVLRGRVLSWGAARRIAVFIAGLGCWLGAGWFSNAEHLVHTRATALIGSYSLVDVGCVLVFLSLLGVPSRAIPSSLIYLGKITYGLYVFHWLILEAVFVAPFAKIMAYSPALPTVPHRSIPVFAGLYLLCLGMTILLSALSYRYFESPFLSLKKRFTFVASRAV